MHSLLLPFTVVMTAFIAPRDIQPITQQELVQHTQQLSDAVAIGDKAPWQLYYADDALYFDEMGRAMDKKALLADLTPLPKGYAGTIHIVKPQSRLLGDTAILAYDLDETETIFGQQLHARYHGTDTWMFRNGRWQIVATQMLRYYEDPAAGTIKPTLLNDYTGTYQLASGVTLKITLDGDKLYTHEPITHAIFFSLKWQTSSSAPGSRDGGSSIAMPAEESTPWSIAATMKILYGKNSSESQSYDAEGAGRVRSSPRCRAR